MPEWFRRAELRRVAKETFGHSEAERVAYHDMADPINRLWEETQDEKLFSWYDSFMYAYVCVESYCDFTHGYVASLAGWWNTFSLMTQDSFVLDIGAGIGASSLRFRELTGCATMMQSYGEGTQAEVFKHLARDGGSDETFATFEEPVNAIRELKPDALLLFDVLEHDLHPMEIPQVAMENGTNLICCANSFTEASDLGHWKQYSFGDRLVERRLAGREFGKAMRGMGWKAEETSFWNGRPQVWTHNDS
jgi:hypothetical protein